jgi:hypothetical protein
VITLKKIKTTRYFLSGLCFFQKKFLLPRRTIVTGTVSFRKGGNTGKVDLIEELIKIERIEF